MSTVGFFGVKGFITLKIIDFRLCQTIDFFICSFQFITAKRQTFLVITYLWCNEGWRKLLRKHGLLIVFYECKNELPQLWL